MFTTLFRYSQLETARQPGLRWPGRGFATDYHPIYGVAEKAKEDGTIDSPVLSKTDNPLKLEDSKHYRDLTIPEVILKSLGFGRDWMTELDPEKRIKIHRQYQSLKNRKRFQDRSSLSTVRSNGRPQDQYLQT